MTHQIAESRLCITNSGVFRAVMIAKTAIWEKEILQKIDIEDLTQAIWVLLAITSLRTFDRH